MSIETYMKRICKQTAVYWGTPTPDKFAKNSFATPIEIKCFWSNKTEMITDNAGKEIVSRATFYVFQDLDEQGMLFFGVLDDLTVAEKADPTKVKKAFEIKQFLKIPSLLNTRKFNRRVMLTTKGV